MTTGYRVTVRLRKTSRAISSGVSHDGHIPMKKILETVEIAKSYRGRRVVIDVSLRVEPGEIVGLLGPNGAGKTTSFYMVVGLISPDSGKVLLDGEDVTSVPMYQRANKGVS